MKAVQTALVGYGFSGSTFHAPLLTSLNEFNLACVVSSNEEKVKKDLPDTKVVSTVEAVLERADIELVIVTTPSGHHFDITKKVLESGKHVVVEKPMVPTVKEARELTACAAAHGVMLSVYQNRRFDGNFQTVQKLMREGRIGELYVYEAHYDRFEPAVGTGWREQKKPGSGILYDLGTHLIDQAFVLFGMPDSVTADVQKQRRGAEVDDYFHLILAYGSRRVILHSSMVVVEQGAKYRIHGTKGTFMKQGEDPQEEELLAGKRPAGANWGMDPLAQYGTLYTNSGSEKIVTLPGDYRRYYEGVFQCIKNGQPCPVPGEEAVKTLQIIEAALESSEKQKTVWL